MTCGAASHLDELLMMEDSGGGGGEMPVDRDMGSELVVRLIGMGSVSGLKSFLAFKLVYWEGLGEGDEDILSLREKSSGPAAGVRRDTRTCCCFRREERESTVVPM
jgi:hypothetical protein